MLFSDINERDHRICACAFQELDGAVDILRSPERVGGLEHEDRIVASPTASSLRTTSCSTGIVGVSSRASSGGRRNGTSSPYCRPMPRSLHCQLREAPGSNAWRLGPLRPYRPGAALPISGAIFLRGIPFDPPRAGTIPRTFIRAPVPSFLAAGSKLPLHKAQACLRTPKAHPVIRRMQCPA